MYPAHSVCRKYSSRSAEMSQVDEGVVRWVSEQSDGLGGPSYKLSLPADFQLVRNLMNPRAAERFLGHLLLEEASDGAFERHASFAGLKTQRAMSDIGVSFQGAGYAGFQGAGVDHERLQGAEVGRIGREHVANARAK